MCEEEYLMHMAVADRLREARAAAAGRVMLGSRAAWGGRLADVYLDRRLLAFTRGVRLRTAGTVVRDLLCRITTAAGSRDHSRATRKSATGKDTNMDATKGFVVPAGGGKHLDMGAPGRFAALKLLGHETNESIMLFEETVPVGTKSLFHLHRDSDEVAWVLAGEIAFKIGDDVTVGGPGTCAFFPRNVPHAWKNTGSETGRVLFLYTPAAAGAFVEELLNRPGPINDDERDTLRERYRWEVVGPNPL